MELGGIFTTLMQEKVGLSQREIDLAKKELKVRNQIESRELAKAQAKLRKESLRDAQIEKLK